MYVASWLAVIVADIRSAGVYWSGATASQPASSPAQKRVMSVVRAAMDFGFSWPRCRASHSSRILCLMAARASASGQSTIWFFLVRNRVQNFLADSPGYWVMWLKSSASGGRMYVPWKLSRKASSRFSQLPMEFAGKLFSQCLAGPLSLRGRYLMACRSSLRAM